MDGDLRLSEAARTMTDMLPRLARTPLDLLLPTRCAGCGYPGVACCARCRSGIPLRLDAAALPLLDLGRLDARGPAMEGPNLDGLNMGALDVTAATDYGGAVRRLLLAYKEADRLDLAPALGGLLAPAVLGAALRTGIGGPLPQRLELVPVPSRRRTRRRRGADLVLLLARAAAARLRAHGWPVRVTPVLRHVGGGVDQVGLDRRERARNVAASLSARPGRDTTGASVVIVDDIVTTGATLREAVRALAVAGHPAAGAAVVAATPLSGATRPAG